MKKVLLSVFALSAGLTAMAQNPGINDVAAYDNFKKASQYSNQYSIEVVGKEDCSDATQNAYKGIFTYSDKTVAADNFGLTVTRNMTEGQLELDVTQLYGKYEPFGFIFGTYCPGNKDFTLDLSNNAMLDFTVKVASFTDENDGSGDPTGGEGVQIKIQATDINDVTLAFDKSGVGEAEAWRYEIGVTGDGSQASNFGGSDHAVEGDVVHIQYDLKDAETANDAVDGIDESKTFDYSQVKAVKITFVSNNKDKDGGYKSYQSTGKYIITDFKLGDVTVLNTNKATATSAFSVAPNPASDNVTFGKTLTNVSVYNAQGKLVETLSSANSLNVSSYTEGVYMINATEGSARILVK